MPASGVGPPCNFILEQTNNQLIRLISASIHKYMFTFRCIFIHLLTFGCLIGSGAQAQLSVANGERVSITSAGELVLLEDLTNNGTIDDLTLGGTSAQSISGTGTIVNLKLSKSAIGNIATITGGMQSLIGTLDLTAGTLAAGGYLTLKSSLAGTARVATHTTAGAVTGDVVVERFINVHNRKKQWRMLGFPYSGELTINNIQGMGKTFTASTNSIMYFQESDDNGAYGSSGARNQGYKTYTAGTDKIAAGAGVMAWLYPPSGTPGTSSDLMSDSLNISSFGNLRESGADVTYNLSFTSSLPLNKRGWNLVSNPFASSISWNSLTRTNINEVIYRWDPQAINWTTYNGSTGTNGATDGIIESGAAFFILASTTSPVLTIPQSAKVSGNSGYVHFSRSPFRLDIPGQRVPSSLPLSGVRIKASGPGNPIPSEAYLDISRPDATSGFDAAYDAVSMGRSSGADVAIKGSSERIHAMQFDQPIAQRGKEKRYYPLVVTGASTGASSLTLRTEGNWNPLNSVSLIDHQEGKTLLMRGNELRYDFQLESLKTEGRFTLAINHVKLDASGQSPVFDVKLLGNPVTGDRLQLLVTHPSAAAREWRVMSSDGRVIGRGNFPQDAGIQHGITVPAMRSTGNYLLQVEMDNGELKSVPFIRK